MASCVSAVEARCNHMIAELVERERLSAVQAKSLERLSARNKWFLLPRFAEKPTSFDPSRWPHQAIAEICSSRNDLVHVNYEGLEEGIFDAKKALRLFRGFVEAMAEMNSVIRGAPRDADAGLGVFAQPVTPEKD